MCVPERNIVVMPTVPARTHTPSRHAPHPRWIPASHAREHLLILVDGGMPRAEVARRSGVNRLTLLRIIRGDLTQVTPHTARAVLTVSPCGLAEQSAGRVDGTGTSRRLRALSAQGWPSGELARRLEVSQSHLRRLMDDGSGCFAATRARVIRLYEELWDVPAPKGRASTIARNRARARGWAVSLAWDDDDLDDPYATPYPTQRQGRRDVIAEIEELLEFGENVHGVCRRMGLKPASIWMATHRHARPDLWLRLNGSAVEVA